MSEIDTSQFITTEEKLTRSYELVISSPDAHAMMMFFMACGRK
ncbi:hypothetical protein DFQ01_1221 [Paenibacillus cellulosilyticus]|uniref:Uncharacterized protein n=1 Tax=Paenibacillus cellulosilyticus TaxID=375489 RepID=A0A2V2YN67_9BACL|nr:hypothetical protein DFQ01_1221 [Paenibacillus cellulosilyticus]